MQGDRLYNNIQNAKIQKFLVTLRPFRASEQKAVQNVLIKRASTRGDKRSF